MGVLTDLYNAQNPPPPEEPGLGAAAIGGLKSGAAGIVGGLAGIPASFAKKKVDALVTGEGSHGLKDQSEAALKISQLVSEHIKNYKADGTRQERIDDMMELGYTRAQATSIVDKNIEL